MIQSVRSSKSDSFLREAQEAILNFEDSQIEDFFYRSIMNIVEKRNDPEKVYTGAKETRENILSYLEQRGLPQTANIWARKIKFDIKAISELKYEIKQALKEHKIEGITEIHLQDREINSPHIQFVGNNAKEAERIIAEILIKHNYEDSLETAINNNAKPAYFELESRKLPRKKLLSDKLQETQAYEEERKLLLEEKEKKESQVQELFKSITNRADKFRNMLRSFEEDTGFRKEDRFDKIRRIKSMSIEELKQNYFKRRKQR